MARTLATSTNTWAAILHRTAALFLCVNQMAYTTKERIYAKFGRHSVIQWADLENAERDGVETVDSDARIAYEIEIVSAEIDDEIRIIYHAALPFDTHDPDTNLVVATDLANVPLTIQDIATCWVGYKLYIGRSIIEDDDPVLLAWQEAKDKLARVKARQITLSRASADITPSTGNETWLTT